MNFDRATRKRLFDGETPRISGDGVCPAEPGDVFDLSALVSLKVTRVHRNKTGGWWLSYEVTDRRDPVRLLRRTPGIPAGDYELVRGSFDEYGYPSEPTPVAVAEAAEESAYTPIPGTLADAGEAVDELTQRRLTAEAHRNKEQGAVLAQLRRERYELAQRLDRARGDARLRGVDISSMERVIERQLRKIEQRVYHGKAA